MRFFRRGKPEPVPESNGRIKVMVVTGPSRSCTSGVAKGLHEAGWHMGDKLFVGNRYNKWGYYESSDTMKLNDRILKYHGGAWNKPPKEITKLNQALVQQVRDYIGKRAGNTPSEDGRWGVKDPRITLVWPYWEAAFESFPHLEPIVVAPMRSTKEAATSLWTRDNLEYEEAWDLTKAYQRKIATLFDGKPAD